MVAVAKLVGPNSLAFAQQGTHVLPDLIRLGVLGASVHVMGRLDKQLPGLVPLKGIHPKGA
jgi:hypothetical protein